MGWGSNQQFEYGEAEVYKGKRSTVGFENGLNGVKFKAAAGTLIPSYNHNENGTYSIFGGNSDTYSLEIIPGMSPMVASLPNLLTHKIPVQKGDSGGPLFICDEQDNACWLIGVTSYGDSDVEKYGYDIATTLANPFYDLITKPYKM